MTTDALVEEVSPVFGRAGSAWYFLPETLAAGREIGLDGMRFYICGRGGVLGAVDWRIVSSAFGYFHPGTIERLWTTGLERADLGTVVATHLEACARWGRTHLSGLPGLDAFCDAAASVVRAAEADLGGLTLFAGYAAQPVPEEPPARAAHLVAVLRELRGSAHLAAVVAAGLPTQVAHAIRRPDDVALFGWKEGEIPTPTDEDRRRLLRAEEMTRDALRRCYTALDPEQAGALAAGARGVAAVLG